MKVKKYTSSTLKEALAQIRIEMGEEALIISTREMSAPLGKKFIEVTAAAVEKKPSIKSHPEKKKRSSFLDSEWDTSIGKSIVDEQVARNKKILGESLKPLKDELFHLRSLMKEIRRANRDKSVPDLAPLRDEVRSLKKLFIAMSKTANFDNLVDFPKTLKQIYHQLVSSEVEESASYSLIEILDKQLSEEEKEDPGACKKALKALIEKSVVPAKPVILNQKKPKVMAFVGPTGVGKTTTIAKLAARCTLQMKKKVTLITIDTYRIAAVEQLKTYAKIMDLPIFVCYSKEEMHQTIKESSDSALILIDTAGHSQTDAEQVSDLSALFAGSETIDILLVLSATTKNNDLKDVIERFGPVKASKLVFTKLDETTTYGPLLNETIRTSLPIGYFTTGQNVPDDIETATPAKLSNMIINSLEM